MSFAAGVLLGPYEVLSPLGAGGMGEVYRARDTRLKRDVAVKVLPERLSHDREALSRFEREALAVAALSHPGIVSIFDIGEDAGVRYAVTELLEGETLRDLVRRGPLPQSRALDVARQIADALAAAHEKRIVHRDLKPENVLLTKDGQAKVLDFGLARQETGPPDETDARSLTTSLTGPGAVLGTVAYMSPEQASGIPTDHRSDQFSLGIVLYEMLSGRRPFRGESAAETLTAIIREEPDPIAIAAPAAPIPVHWLLERCLAKSPSDRYDSTRDLARELKTLSLRASDVQRSGGTTAVPAGRGRRSVSRRALVAAAGASLLLGGSVAATLLLRHQARSAAPALRFEVRLPEGWLLWPNSGAVDLSPDGSRLVFSAFTPKKPLDTWEDPQLFIRPLDELECRPIPGTVGGVVPAFSPDGRHVAIAGADRGKPFLRTVSVAGNVVRTVCECDATFGIAWMPDGTIVFSGGDGPLSRVPATGGTPEPATQLDAAEREYGHRLPHRLPDGRSILYTALRSPGPVWKTSRIYVGRPGEKERRLLVEGGSDGRYSPPGTLVFARDGKLLAAPFDAEAGRLAGKPTVVLEGVRHVVYTGWVPSEKGAAQVAVANGGLLAWSPGSVTPPVVRTPVWLDATGTETPLEGGPTDAPVLSARVSPDGRGVLLSYNYPGHQAEVVDLARGGRRQVTFDRQPAFPIWGPGPDTITFGSARTGLGAILSRRLNTGPDEIETLWTGRESPPPVPGSWSRDGRVLAFVLDSPKSGLDVWLLERGKEARPFVASRFNERWPDISPDGRWLVYTSDASGRNEVFARPLAAEGATLQVSTGTGVDPLWSHDGKSVLFWQEAAAGSTRTLFRVLVAGSPDALAFGVPERLLTAEIGDARPGHGWDVAPDGRFLVRKVMDEPTRRAWRAKNLSSRIVVDTGGLAHLLAEAKAGH